VWVDVQVCRGPTGERLKRADWMGLGRGHLTIGYTAPAGNHALTATLDKRTQNGPRSLTWPLFDVRVRTYGDGMLVIGFQIASEAGVVREFRQAWYCVPVARG
jgi:hypothetical protein